MSDELNIVLIGMPTSGKTTVSGLLGERTGRKVVEMDDEIEKILGTSIRKCFEEKGEAYFRNLETQQAEKLGKVKNCIISCGGGVIKRPVNMKYLSENGIICWIRRDPGKLFPADTRPLSSNRMQLEKLYEERLPLYEKYSDYEIDNNGTLEDTVRQILEIIGER